MTNLIEAHIAHNLEKAGFSSLKEGIYCSLSHCRGDGVAFSGKMSREDALAQVLKQGNDPYAVAAVKRLYDNDGGALRIYNNECDPACSSGTTELSSEIISVKEKLDVEWHRFLADADIEATPFRLVPGYPGWATVSPEALLDGGFGLSDAERAAVHEWAMQGMGFECVSFNSKDGCVEAGVNLYALNKVLGVACEELETLADQMETDGYAIQGATQLEGGEWSNRDLAVVTTIDEFEHGDRFWRLSVLSDENGDFTPYDDSSSSTSQQPHRPFVADDVADVISGKIQFGTVELEAFDLVENFDPQDYERGDGLVVTRRASSWLTDDKEEILWIANECSSELINETDAAIAHRASNLTPRNFAAESMSVAAATVVKDVSVERDGGGRGR